MTSLKPSDGVDLQEDLDGPTMQKLVALGRKMVFAPNQYLYHQGDPAKQVLILQTGSVKATSTHPQGFDALLKIHQAGSLLGLSALRVDGLRDANGIAINEVHATCFSRDLFLSILENDGTLGIAVVRLLLKRQQELHARLRDILGYSVEQRLADVLVQLNAESETRGSGGGSHDISITHEDLASLIISRRQYVTQILREFVGRGLIATGRKTIRVIDPDGLRRIADH